MPNPQPPARPIPDEALAPASRERSIPAALLAAARPRQWVKNLFVAAPVIFAKQLLDAHLALRAVSAVAIFCLVASGVYLWNDIVDVDKDRAHPRKRTRPIASGELPLPVARAASAMLAAVGLALATLLGLPFTLAVFLYLVQNVGYSFVLKRIPYVDVLTIASGFLLRVWAGSLAVGVWASPWLFLCTGLLACFNGFGKRSHELSGLGERGAGQRAVLEAYSPRVLRFAMVATGGATVVAYFFYTLAAHTRAFFGTGNMVYTSPFVAFGVARFLHLTATRESAESPTEEMLRDPWFMGNLAVWAVAVLLVIYTAH